MLLGFYSWAQCVQRPLVEPADLSSLARPEGGTVLGFGVKFEGEGSPAPGQNARASPVVIQYVDDKPNVVCPKHLQLREPVPPLARGSRAARR